jgi:hypothetical protein
MLIKTIISVARARSQQFGLDVEARTTGAAGYFAGFHRCSLAAILLRAVVYIRFAMDEQMVRRVDIAFRE